MKSHAACLFFDLAPSDSNQPPDMLVLPGAAPSCVGMAAVPSTVLYCGQGFVPEGFQLPVCHEPSSAMASLPLGMRSVLTFVPHWVSSSSCGSGPSFSLNTVRRKFIESVSPLLDTIHFLDALSYSVSLVPYRSISRPCIVAPSPAAFPA